MGIRNAKKGDLKQYYILRSNATKEYSKIINTKTNKESFNEIKKDFNKYLSSEKLILLVFEDSNKIVAYLNGSLEKSHATIDYLFVDKGYRRKGIGESIINGFLNLLKSKKIKTCRLKVNIQNDVAIKCYRKFGLEISNYEMKKIGDAEPTEFHRPKKIVNNTTLSTKEQVLDSSNVEGKILPNDRTEIFAKRAQVNKIKKSTDKVSNILKQIQQTDDIDESGDLESDDDLSAYEDLPFTENLAPLNRFELNDIENDNIFGFTEPPTSKAITIDEIKRIQRLEEMSSGSVGIIKRSS